jgi:hypothetical protein
MRGDAHFALTAAAQLFRTLKNFDGDLRLPENINESEVRTLRNALEHWDDEDGPAKRAMAALGADPTSHRWSQVNGGGRLGDLVEDEALLQWSRKVYDELLDFDPPSPWAEGQPS